MHIGALNEIVIEDNVLIGSHVLIIDHNHGTTEDVSKPPVLRELVSTGKVHIKRNVWIGENCMIFPNVTIGENSIIGAGSVVTKDIPANSVAVGNPAKVIKHL